MRGVLFKNPSCSWEIVVQTNTFVWSFEVSHRNNTIYIYTYKKKQKKKQDIYHISWRTPWYIYIIIYLISWRTPWYIYIIIYLISWQTPRFMCIYIIIMCCGEANNKPSPIEVYCWVYSHYDDGNWPPVIVRGSPALQEGHCLSGFSRGRWVSTDSRL
jgi:hypothetical protein